MNQYEEAFNRLLEEHNITVRKYRTNMTGVAYIDKREIVIPHPRGKISFLVGLHEIGHCVNGHIKPRHYEEYLAEQWAMKKAHELGFKVPRSYRVRAKRYVRFKIRQALMRGADPKKLNKEAAKWSNK